MYITGKLDYCSLRCEIEYHTRLFQDLHHLPHWSQKGCYGVIVNFQSETFSKLPSNPHTAENFCKQQSEDRAWLCDYFFVISICELWVVELQWWQFCFHANSSFYSLRWLCLLTVLYRKDDDSNVHLSLRSTQPARLQNLSRFQVSGHELPGCYVSPELWSSSLLASDTSSGSGSLQGGVPAAATGRLCGNYTVALVTCCNSVIPVMFSIWWDRVI